MNLRVAVAEPADDAAIRNLVRRQPVPGRISLTYEREPSFALGCQVTGQDCRILLARDERSGDVVGVACRSERRLFVNGAERRLGYLGQLRIDDDYRGRWLVARGFSLLRQWHEQAPLPGYLAALVDGNEQARGVLVERPRRQFPLFHKVANYRTLALAVGRRKRPLLGEAVISPAAATHELGEVARFLEANGVRRQFFPLWTEEALRELIERRGLELADLRIARAQGEIVGVMGLWDQSAYKQTVVHGYTGWLKLVRPMYNVVANCLGRPRLPRPQQQLRSAYAAFICVAEENTDLFAALLRDLYNHASVRGFEYILLGLDARDPFLPTAQRYQHVVYPSQIYLAEWADATQLHAQLDSRPTYVEIATL